MKKIINFFKNNKRKGLAIIISSIIVITLAIIIPLTYTSQYCKHPLFDEERLEISDPKNNDYFDFDLYALNYIEATFTTEDTYKSGNLKLKASIYSKASKLKDVKIQFLLTSFWDKEWENNQSKTTEYEIGTLTNGNTLENPTDKTFSNTYNVTIKRAFPIKPLPFVKVEHPTLYVKITYTIPGVKTDRTESMYFQYEYEDLVNDETKFE